MVYVQFAGNVPVGCTDYPGRTRIASSGNTLTGCTDSDGNNLLTQGTVKDKTGATYTDSCQPSYKQYGQGDSGDWWWVTPVIEYTCGSDQVAVKTEALCGDYGCGNGKCLTSAVCGDGFLAKSEECDPPYSRCAYGSECSSDCSSCYSVS
jgi:hypothetical protein